MVELAFDGVWVRFRADPTARNSLGIDLRPFYCIAGGFDGHGDDVLVHAGHGFLLIGPTSLPPFQMREISVAGSR